MPFENSKEMYSRINHTHTAKTTEATKLSNSLSVKIGMTSDELRSLRSTSRKFKMPERHSPRHNAPCKQIFPPRRKMGNMPVELVPPTSFPPLLFSSRQVETAHLQPVSLVGTRFLLSVAVLFPPLSDSGKWPSPFDIRPPLAEF